MDTAYRIKDWNKHYETAQSKRLIGGLNWLRLSAKINGDAYNELVRGHEDGPKHFAAWVSLIQVACGCKVRGTLARDDGRPHTPSSLSLKTGIPADWYAGALPRLANEIGWIEEVPGAKCGSSADPHQIHTASAENQTFACKPSADPQEKMQMHIRNNTYRKQETVDTNTSDFCAAVAPVCAAPPPVPEPTPELETFAEAVAGEPILEADDGWVAFTEAIEEADMPVSSPDLTAMRKRWRSLAIEERLAALQHVRESIDEGVYGAQAEKQYIPNARPYLFDKRWERGVRKRAGPQQSSVSRAAMIYMQSRNTG